MLTVIKKKLESFRLRNKYCANDRLPFFSLAGRYLPDNKSNVVIDIGAGTGEFAKYLNLKERYDSFFLLDGNKETVARLKKYFKKVDYYVAPGKLPFEDLSINFIHCSHLVEHLRPEELFIFLKELDRVLGKNGIIAISAPMFWSRFYDDLSHIRPYNPSVFINYLSFGRDNPTNEIISKDYIIEELVFRYRCLPADENIWGSKFFIFDFLLKVLAIFLNKLGFRRYIKNGYTLILRKK